MDGGDAFLSDPERGRTPEGDLDPNQIAHDLAFHGQKYAEANADAKLLEEQKSVVLATLVQHYRAEGKMRRVSKQAAGAILDGREHKEFPA